MDSINSKEQFSQSYGSLGIKQGGVEYAKAMDSLGGYIPDLGNSGTNTQGLTTNYVDADIASPNFKTGVSGWQIRQDGSAEFQNISIGQKIITIDTSGSISGAITSLGSSGGTIFLKPGTYTVTTAVAIPSNVTIQGQSPSGTIINFNSTAANFTMTGSSVYNTGTITSITSGTAVVGSGTSWLANVTAGSSQLFINDRWYAIASVADNTHLTLSESYAGPTVSAGTSYRIAVPIHDSKLINLTLKSSTGTALAVTDARDLTFDDVLFLSSNVGFSFTNVSATILRIIVCAGNTSDGYQFTRVGFTDAQYIASSGNGGNGATFNDVRTMDFLASASNANTGDGFNITSGVDTTIEVQASSNGGQGIEMVSGCDNIAIVNCLVDSNTSDGIKLTASSDNCRIDTGKITSNGGYGINIANSNCDNNLILAPYFASNTSGSVSDSGTNTIRIQQGDRNVQYGDGSDGDVTISADTTLTSDKFYNNLTVNSGKTLTLAGWRVFVKNTMSVSGTISVIGGAGGAGTAGSDQSGNGGSSGGAGGSAGSAAASSNFIKGSIAGKSAGAGSNAGNPPSSGTAGTAGTSETLSFNSSNGATGGNGGSRQGEGSGGGAGGAGGTSTQVFRPGSLQLLDALYSFNPTGLLGPIAGSGSGGGGKGGQTGVNTAATGGGGAGGSGGGGGIVYIAAKDISVSSTGTITANGGAGGAGANGGNASGSVNADTGGGGGGGAGGGGGVILIQCSTISISASGAITANGGAGGAAGGGGTATSNNPGTGNAGAGNGGNGGDGGNGGIVKVFYGASYSNSGTVSANGGAAGAAGAAGTASGGFTNSNGAAGSAGTAGSTGVVTAVQG